MMRKRDEGYALAFVLVVVVVICLVAVSMMTVSLRNLEAQTASVERMKDKYEAQGIVEQIVSSIDSGVEFEKKPEDTSKEIALDRYFNTLIKSVIPEYDRNENNWVTVYVGEGSPADSFTAQLTLEAQSESGTVQVNAVIGCVANIEEDTVNNKYIVTNPNVTYISHEVVSNGGGA